MKVVVAFEIKVGRKARGESWPSQCGLNISFLLSGLRKSFKFSDLNPPQLLSGALHKLKKPMCLRIPYLLTVFLA